jgi:hypothetical protein
MEPLGAALAERPLIAFINFDTCIIDIDSEVLNELNGTAGSQTSNSAPTGKSRSKSDQKAAKRVEKANVTPQEPMKRTHRALVDEFESEKMKTRVLRIMKEVRHVYL